MTTKVPKGQVQFVIHLVEGWWAAIGRDESEGGPSSGKFKPVQFRMAAKRGAARRTKAASAAKAAKKPPTKSKPKLSLVPPGKRQYTVEEATVSEHDVAEHTRHLRSGKTTTVRAYHRGPHARRYA